MSELANLLRYSLESSEPVQPAKTKEQEFCCYAKISNPAGLDQAQDKEDQEQAEIKIDKRRKIRVRKTTKAGQAAVYEITSKVATANKDAAQLVIEQTQPISPQAYELFKNICPSYNRKTRYFFKVEKASVVAKGVETVLQDLELVYEVDVFHNETNKESTWCKIDLEVQDLVDKLKELDLLDGEYKLNVKLSSLPFAPSSILIDTEENSEKIAQLWKNEFLSFNLLVGETRDTAMNKDSANQDRHSEQAQVEQSSDARATRVESEQAEAEQAADTDK